MKFRKMPRRQIRLQQLERPGVVEKRGRPHQKLIQDQYRRKNVNDDAHIDEETSTLTTVMITAHNNSKTPIKTKRWRW